MLPSKLSFLDVETTGTSPTRDRIIEIGIVRVEDGKIKEEFESLVDPDVYLPPEITHLTGISSIDLESAPNFRKVKEKIDDLTKGTLVLAHNAQFDVSFLKAEYERVGDRFKNKSLCTAKLSRFLFPRFHHHNLDSIVERFGLVCEPRHRAFPDARVLWDFYKTLQKTIDSKDFTKAIKILLKKQSLPAGLPEKLVNKLPHKPGVYIFYGERHPDDDSRKSGDSIPLYIGKSVNIHDRVMSHFNSTHKSGKELSIAQQIKFIEHQETEGELAALLRERELIAKLQPLYNRQLRLTESLTVLKRAKTDKGYESLETIESNNISIDDLADILAVFKTKAKAKKALLELADEYNLCHKLLGLENGDGACFRSQIEKCNGACSGAEMPIKYNIRFAEAFARLKLKQWPFKGPILIKEGQKAHLVYKWCYLGIMDSEADTSELLNQKPQFDFDTYKILVKFVLKPEYEKNIVNLLL